MGGMGKTTIADAVFQIISHQFEKRTYFAKCVRAQSEKDSSGLFHLRDKILSKVLKKKNLKFDCPSIPQRIKEMLNKKKVLIVLDDVDDFTKLEILAGCLDRFGPGNRIILTTRDKQVLRNCGVKDHNMYEVKGLNHDEAFQLFCNHAFKQNHPTKDFEVLSRGVVKIVRNVPLAVKVLGSLLYTKSKQEWENAKDQFQRNVNPKVFDALKISYDGLDEEEKGLFLDIACFLVFQRVDDFKPNLLSDRELSLSGLIDKSLVTVEDGRIEMHDLLREMGREIASKNRSRLWRQKDVLRTLKHNDGTDVVQGIFLSMFKLKDVQLGSQVFTKMYNLRTLIIKYGPPLYKDYGQVHLRISDLDYLPDKLRYLHWESYPLEVLPSSFNPVNLVELDLFDSNIKQLWERRTCVPKLKRLNLSFCRNLIRIQDLSDIPSAESINLERCISLLEIHSSTECPKLKRLNLHGCKNLIRITDLSDIPSVESINLKFCSSLLEIHSSTECPKLKQLDLSYCENLIRIPDLSDIPSAESINLKLCSSLLEIHSSRECPKLKQLDLFCCENLIRIPDLSDIPSAESINLKLCSSLLEIHSSRKCPKLKQLDLSCCENLIRIPDLSNIPSAESINLKSCSSLLEIHSSRECPKLKQLDLSSCENLIRILDLSNIPSAESINLKSCSSLLEIHSSRECPKNLLSLQLSECKNLSIFPSYIHIEGSDFSLSGCSSLTKFPHISGNVKELVLSGSGVEEVPSTIQSLSKLERLDMSNCTRLKHISKSICKLKSLDELDLRGCCKLESFPDILEGMELKYLNISGTAIKEIPPSIGNLNRLNLEGCWKFESFPDILEGMELKYLNLSGTAIKELLPSIGYLNQLDLGSCGKLESFPDILEGMELKYLNLSGTAIKELSPSIGNLNWLDLDGCWKLESFPDILEGMELKYLNIGGTAIKELPPSIGNLNQLDLEGCWKLESFPDILEGMELKYLNLSGTEIKELPPSVGYFNRLDLVGCWKLESFPHILEGMELKYLDLSRTAIKELPPSIGNLNRLEQLVFCICKNLERLPKSIKKLSKLYSLKLNHCGMLRSLPELPSSLQHLEAINCKMLIQSLPDSSLGSGSLYFNFINCLKMNQKAVSNLLIFFRDSLRKMQCMGTEKIISLFERGKRKEVEGSICLPGSEIPEWFCYENNGSSINIPGLRNDFGRSRYIMGFAVCLAFEFDFDIGISEQLDVRYDFHIETRDGHKEGFFNEFTMFCMLILPIEDRRFIDSDHIFLGHNLSSKCYELFQKLDTLLANCGMSDYVGTSFEFNFQSKDILRTLDLVVK